VAKKRSGIQLEWGHLRRAAALAGGKEGNGHGKAEKVVGRVDSGEKSRKI